MAFFRGGRKRGNPAMGKKRMRQGEKETHNFMLWEKYEGSWTKTIAYTRNTPEAKLHAMSTRRAFMAEVLVFLKTTAN